MTEPFDSFFDRDKLDTMPAEDLLPLLKKGIQDAEDWFVENPDPER